MKLTCIVVTFCESTQEASLQMGLAYMVSAVALFDEYTNDMLYLREGSCFPRCVFFLTNIPTATRHSYVNSLYLFVSMHRYVL